MQLMFHCRAGYEADLLAELDKANAELGQYGYATFKKNSANLIFSMPALSLPSDAQKWCEVYAQTPALSSLIFARQKMLILGELEFSSSDRISEIVMFLQALLKGSSAEANKSTRLSSAFFSDVVVEYFDTEEDKPIAKFCKKFSVPLRQALRKQSLLVTKSNAMNTRQTRDKAFLHIIFSSSERCSVGVNFANDRSQYPQGVLRLKMPSDAPSRSTLKLEEAIKTFFNRRQETALFMKGMRAVDLGACPGGWSYQLVQRNITVEAVDHGEIAENLMATGLVEYYPKDGFLYQPKEGNVDWLVCDMLEQPTRVSELMLAWLLDGRANAAIFNLKLPMNKRFKVLDPIFEQYHSKLHERFDDFVIKAKHLYHNRDEITVMVIVNGPMLEAFYANQVST
jgi:23S rRNA (cytidine2498-2'-O)-methyltransferase